MSKTGELRLRRLVSAAILAAAALLAPAGALASSHNEAPFTSKNPSLDDTDFYMFRDPNDPSMVNLIACRYGLIEPQGGPNYAGFQDGAWYDIKIDNNGDGVEDVTFRFTFKTTYKQPSTFLYAVPPVASITDPNLLVVQTYSLDKITGPAANPSAGPDHAHPHGSARLPTEHRIQDVPGLREHSERHPEERGRQDLRLRRTPPGSLLRGPRYGL